jgi:anhydro-N-acetylmuramic acid kinase
MKISLGRRTSDAHVTAPSPKVRTQRREERARLVIGCMTGTSLDGLDAALVRIEGHGLAMRVEFVSGTSRPLGELAGPLRWLAEQAPVAAGEIARVAREFALLHLDAIRELRTKRIDLIVAHGQTVFHAPPVSWQLFNPAPLAYELGVPVVCDLRAADLACGGEGAPITPLSDYILFRHGSEARAVVNLGGFCNLTRLPASNDAMRVEGADVCACNQLLDGLARKLFDQPFDRDGANAERGEVLARPLAALATVLETQARSGRSLGTGDELGAWIERHRERNRAQDLARTACAGIAQTIAKRTPPARRVVLAGGGTRNRALVSELRTRAGVTVVTSDELGVPSEMREAAGMAVLGALCQDRVAITLPGVTGVKSAPISGCWTLP